MKIRSGFVSNSSSSSFVCRTDNSVEDVEAELAALLQFYNAWMEEDEEYNEVFGEVVSMKPGFLPYTEQGWGIRKWEQANIDKSKLVIRSACDNTIPYSLWELIERKYNAFRIHRG